MGRTGRRTVHAATSCSSPLPGSAMPGPAPAPPGTLYDLVPRAPLLLRARFSVADAAHVRVLELRVAYNDAFVAYVNGQEIARRGIAPNGTRRRRAARPGDRAPLHSGAVGRAPVAAARRQPAGGRGLRLARASGGRSRRRRPSSVDVGGRQRRPDRARPLPVDADRGPRRARSRAAAQLADRSAGHGDGHARSGRRRRGAAARPDRSRSDEAATRQAATVDGLDARRHLQLPRRRSTRAAATARAPVRTSSRRWPGRRSRCASPSTATCATRGTPRIGRSSRRWCARRRR